MLITLISERKIKLSSLFKELPNYEQNFEITIEQNGKWAGI